MRFLTTLIFILFNIYLIESVNRTVSDNSPGLKSENSEIVSEDRSDDRGNVFYDEYEYDESKENSILGKSENPRGNTTESESESDSVDGFPNEVFLSLRNITADAATAFRSFTNRNDVVDLQASASDNLNVTVNNTFEDAESAGINLRALRDAGHPPHIIEETSGDAILLPYKHTKIDTADLSDCALQGEWKPMGVAHGHLHVGGDQISVHQAEVLQPVGSYAVPNKIIPLWQQNQLSETSGKLQDASYNHKPSGLYAGGTGGANYGSGFGYSYGSGSGFLSGGASGISSGSNHHHAGVGGFSGSGLGQFQKIKSASMLSPPPVPPIIFGKKPGYWKFPKTKHKFFPGKGRRPGTGGYSGGGSYGFSSQVNHGGNSGFGFAHGYGYGGGNSGPIMSGYLNHASGGVGSGSGSGGVLLSGSKGHSHHGGDGGSVIASHVIKGGSGGGSAAGYASGFGGGSVAGYASGFGGGATISGEGHKGHGFEGGSGGSILTSGGTHGFGGGSNVGYASSGGVALGLGGGSSGGYVSSGAIKHGFGSGASSGYSSSGAAENGFGGAHSSGYSITGGADYGFGGGTSGGYSSSGGADHGLGGGASSGYSSSGGVEEGFEGGSSNGYLSSGGAGHGFGGGVSSGYSSGGASQGFSGGSSGGYSTSNGAGHSNIGFGGGSAGVISISEGSTGLDHIGHTVEGGAVAGHLVGGSGVLSTNADSGSGAEEQLSGGHGYASSGQITTGLISGSGVASADGVGSTGILVHSSGGGLAGGHLVSLSQGAGVGGGDNLLPEAAFLSTELKQPSVGAGQYSDSSFSSTHVTHGLRGGNSLPDAAFVSSHINQDFSVHGQGVSDDLSSSTFTCGKNHDHNTNYHTATFQVADHDHPSSVDVLRYGSDAAVLIKSGETSFHDSILPERKHYKTSHLSDAEVSGSDNKNELTSQTAKLISSPTEQDAGQTESEATKADDGDEPERHSYYHEITKVTKIPSTSVGSVQYTFSQYETKPQTFSTGESESIQNEPETEPPQVIRELEHLSNKFQLDLENPQKLFEDPPTQELAYHYPFQDGEHKNLGTIEGTKEENHEGISEFPYKFYHNNANKIPQYPVTYKKPVVKYIPRPGKPHFHQKTTVNYLQPKPPLVVIRKPKPKQFLKKKQNYEVNEHGGERHRPIGEVFPPQKFPKQFHNPKPNFAVDRPKNGWRPDVQEYKYDFSHGKKLRKFKTKAKVVAPILIRRPVSPAPVIRVVEVSG